MCSIDLYFDRSALILDTFRESKIKSNKISNKKLQIFEVLNCNFPSRAYVGTE